MIRHAVSWRLGPPMPVLDATATLDLAPIAAEAKEVRAWRRPEPLPALEAWLRSLKSASDLDRHRPAAHLPGGTRADAP